MFTSVFDFMNKDLFINGLLHKCFTQCNFSPDDDTIHQFSEYFPDRHYFIAAFSTVSKELNIIPYPNGHSIPDDILKQADFNTYSYITEDNLTLLFINSGNIDAVKTFITNIQDYFDKRCNLISYWGISHVCFTLSELFFAKKEAAAALDTAKQAASENIHIFDTNQEISAAANTAYFYPDILRQMLIYSIKNMDYTLLDFIITVLYDENTRIPQHAGSFLQLNFHIVDTLLIFNSTKHSISDRLLSFSQNAAALKDAPKQYFNSLTMLCREISEQITTQKNHQKNQMVKDIQIYIRNNFNDATLNLSSVAEHFKRSEGYLSALFKETSGTSFSEHLEKCRIDEACRLLISSDKSISEIACLTGYNSVYSFRRAFKRILNSSPKDYRIKNSADQP